MPINVNKLIVKNVPTSFTDTWSIQKGKRTFTSTTLDSIARDCAGSPTAKLNNYKTFNNDYAKNEVRKFDEKSEMTRTFHYSNTQIKDHAFYRKADFLWNEPEMLEPKKFGRYSIRNLDMKSCFKQQVHDLSGIA